MGNRDLNEGNGLSGTIVGGQLVFFKDLLDVMNKTRLIFVCEQAEKEWSSHVPEQDKCQKIVS